MTTSRWRRRTVAAATAGSLAIGGLLLGHRIVAPADTAAAATAVVETPSAAALEPVADVLDDPDTTAVDALDVTGRWSVSVLELDSGRTLTAGDTTDTYDTASIVKVDILVALLVQQDGELTAAQQEQAAAMIEYSDNASATALFQAVGGAEGLDAFNASIGLTDTTAGTGGSWGLTQTTADDQVRLLTAAFGADAVLDQDAQDLVLGLMGDVIDSQRFGVSAAADDPADAALKVGYLQRSTTGLWDVSSIGVIERDGQTYLVAVLSDSSSTFEDGVATVDAVAEAALQGF